MSTGPSRIRVTVKGRSLQRNILNDPELELPRPITIRRPIIHHQASSQDFSVSGSSTCRTGYFRPKHSTSVALKSQSSTRLYPNYMKQDAREYPKLHECSWVPKSTTKGDKKLEILHPVTKTIHHSFYNPRESRNMSANPTVKEANSLVSGDHGHVTMNITTCKYPEPRVFNQKEDAEVVHYEPANVLAPIYQEIYREVAAGRKPLSMFSTPHETPRQVLPKSLSGPRGALGEILASPGLDMRPSMNRTQSQWPSQARITATSSMNNISFGYKTVTKMSEEKVEQMKNRFDEQQRAYGDLLAKLNKKVQAKYEKQQECPDYLASFDQELRTGGKEIEDLAKKRDNLGTRYAERLKNHGLKKYGKYWGEWEIIGKTKKSREASVVLGSNEEQESRIGKNDSQLSMEKKDGRELRKKGSVVSVADSEKLVLTRLKSRKTMKAEELEYY